MIKLVTAVDACKSAVQLSQHDKIMVLGSCFADEIGRKMQASGFDVCINPFGTLYNPVSLRMAVERLCSGRAFEPADCVEMGAGAGKICSFGHHTSFARTSADEFLENANSSLADAAGFWARCNKVIITLGTAYVWEHRDAGIVANCLKRDAREFIHYRLDTGRCVEELQRIVGLAPDKEFLFTVSPIRHMAQGAHENTLSKATLQLAVDQLIACMPTTLAADDKPRIAYFPAYEILCDELRDYRFYGADLCHPSPLAVDIIWERFVQACVPAHEHAALLAAQKEYKRTQHRPLNGDN